MTDNLKDAFQNSVGADERREAEAYFAEQFGEIGQPEKSTQPAAGGQNANPATPEPASPASPAGAEASGQDGGDNSDEGRGILDRVGSAAGDVLGGLKEAPKQAFAGALDAGNELMDMARQIDTDLGDMLPQAVRTSILTNPGYLIKLVDQLAGEEVGAPELDDADTMTGGFIRGASKFMVGFFPALKSLKMVSAGGSAASSFFSNPIVQDLVAGAIADVVTSDPHEQRLSTMLNQFPALEPYVSDYLADNNPDNEGFWEGKLKTAIEGAALGLVTDYALKAFKAYKGYRKDTAALRDAARSGDVSQMAARDAMRRAAEADIVSPLSADALDALGDESGELLIRGEDMQAAVRSAREARVVRLAESVLPEGHKARITKDGLSVLNAKGKRVAVLELPSNVDEAYLKEIGAKLEQSGAYDKILARVDELGKQVPPEQLSDGLDELINTARAGVRDPAEKMPKYPVLRILKEKGGVKPGSPLAQELEAKGITNKTMPGIINRKGMGAADNLVADEFPELADLADSQGYIDTDGLMAALDDEIAGVPRRTPEQVAAIDAFEAASKNAEEFRRELEAAGINVDEADNAAVRMRLDELEAERGRLREMDQIPAVTEEPQGVPPISEVSDRLNAEGVDVFVSERADHFVLSKIVVPEASRGSGVGTAAMQDLIAAADAAGKPIALTPSADFGGSLSRLKKFYKELGFVENKGANKDYAISESMYRPVGEAVGNPPAPAARDLTKASGPKGKVFINHARIATADDVKELLQQAADEGSDLIDAKSPAYVSNKQTVKDSAKEFTDLADLIGREPGPMDAKQAVAARRVMTASAEQLAELAKKANSAEATAADIYTFRRATAVHQAIMSEVIAARRETARALQSWAIPAGSTKMRADAINDLILNSGGSGDLKRLAYAIQTAAENGPGAVNAVVRKSWQGKLKDVVYEAWVTGLLWSPKTQIVNVTSNTLTALWAIPERLLAAGIDNAFYNGDIQAAEAVQQAFGLVKGARDGFRLASGIQRAHSDVDDLFSMFGKTEHYQTAISASGLDLDPTSAIGQAVDYAGMAIRGSGTMLERADMFFKAVNYRAELHAQALREAVSQGLEGNDLADAVARYIADPPEHIKLAAIDAAHVNTFTKPLGARGRAIQHAIRATPGGRFVVPFVRTPANILKYTFARTPLAPLSAAVRADIAAGGPRAAQAWARIGMGTMVMMTVADYVNEGVITGYGPREPEVRKAWLAAGNQPYSVKIGDRQYQYGRLEPIGMLFGMSADIAEIVHEGGEAGEEVLAAGAISFVQNFASKTWMQGLFDAMAMIDPSNPTSDPGKYAVDMSGTMIPFSSLLRNYTTASDTIVRDARVGERDVSESLGDLPKPVAQTLEAMIRNVQRAIPGQSESLPPKLDMWGQPIDRTAGLGFMYDFLSPIQSKPVGTDPLSDLIVDNRIKVSAPSRTVQGVRLTAEEYHDFSKMAGEMAREQLEQVVKSPGFNRLTDGPDGMKAEVIKSTINAARDAARARLLYEKPALRDAVLKSKRETLETLRGGGQ